MIMLGMGAGPGADAQYLFAEDVLGYTRGHKPRHAKTYRNFAAEYERLQKERVSAFKEFIADVNSGAYPEPQHVVPIADAEFDTFMTRISDQSSPVTMHHRLRRRNRSCAPGVKSGAWHG